MSLYQKQKGEEEGEQKLNFQDIAQLSYQFEPTYETSYDTSQMFCFKTWWIESKTFDNLCMKFQMNVQLGRKTRLMTSAYMQ